MIENELLLSLTWGIFMAMFGSTQGLMLPSLALAMFCCLYKDSKYAIRRELRLFYRQHRQKQRLRRQQLQADMEKRLMRHN